MKRTKHITSDVWTDGKSKSPKILADIMNKPENEKIQRKFLALMDRYLNHIASLRLLRDTERVYFLNISRNDALEKLNNNNFYNSEVKKFGSNVIIGLYRKEMRPLMHTRLTKHDDNSRLLDFRSALLSIYDSLKLADNDSLDLTDETLTEVMWRKMKAYNIDLNKELGFTHLKPTKKNET